MIEKIGVERIPEDKADVNHPILNPKGIDEATQLQIQLVKKKLNLDKGSKLYLAQAGITSRYAARCFN